MNTFRKRNKCDHKKGGFECSYSKHVCIKKKSLSIKGVRFHTKERSGGLQLMGSALMQNTYKSFKLFSAFYLASLSLWSFRRHIINK